MTLVLPAHTIMVCNETYDMTEGTFIIEAINCISSDDVGQIQMRVGAGKHISFVLTTTTGSHFSGGRGPILLASWFFGSSSYNVYTAEYDAAKMRWWRIEIRNKWVYYSYSPDRSYWTVFAVTETFFPIEHYKGLRLELHHRGSRIEGPAKFGEINPPYSDDDIGIPRSHTAKSMQFAPDGAWDGHGSHIGMADMGGTVKMRQKMGVKTLNYREFVYALPDQIYTELGVSPSIFPLGREIYVNQDHGCLVMPDMICHAKDTIVSEVIVGDWQGYASDSSMSYGIYKLTELGAKTVNLSFGSDFYDYTGTDIPPKGNAGYKLFYDMFDAMKAQNKQVGITIAMGNSYRYGWAHPAIFSKFYDFVLSVIALDDKRDERIAFSNHKEESTCAAPGFDIASLSPNADFRTWHGTSGAAPYANAVLLCLATNGAMTMKQAIALLKKTLRKLEIPPSEQGGGAVCLYKALETHGVVQRRGSVINPV